MKCVFLFESIHRVMRAEKILKEKGISFDLIPVPREINSDCGVAVEMGIEWGEAALRILEESKIIILACYTKDPSGRYELRKRIQEEKARDILNGEKNGSSAFNRKS